MPTTKTETKKRLYTLKDGAQYLGRTAAGYAQELLEFLAANRQSLSPLLILPHDYPDPVSQIVEFLLTYQQSRWSLCTGPYKDKLHVSLRSPKQDGQAGEVLRDAFLNPEQAGGHGAIAGGSCPVGADRPEEVWHDKEQALQKRLMKRLRNSLKGGGCKPFVK
jgi:hypothetical protein